MKKILFATTALVATAGVASAEIKLTGLAEMGVVGGDYLSTDQFFTDIDVTFNLSGESDNGLTFGASIDLDESDGSGSASYTGFGGYGGSAGHGGCFITDNDDIDQAMTINGETVDFGNVTNGVTEGGAFSDGDQNNAECNIPSLAAIPAIAAIPAFSVNGASPAFSGTSQGGETIFISYGGATLTMGDTDGAFDWAMKEVGIGGSIADDHTTHTGFNFNSGLDGTYDGQIARFDYSFDAFSVALSAEMDDSDTFDPVWGIGFKYNAMLAGLDLGLGIAYQSVDFGGGVDVDVWGLSLDTTFDNGLQTIVNYSETDIAGLATVDHWGLGLGYTMNALTLSANYGEYNAGGLGKNSGFGLAANYDLGGGLVVQFGYGASDADFATGGGVFGNGGGLYGGSIGENHSYSMGLAMSF